jgi:hypothetical protein
MIDTEKIIHLAIRSAGTDYVDWAKLLFVSALRASDGQPARILSVIALPLTAVPMLRHQSIFLIEEPSQELIFAVNQFKSARVRRVMERIWSENELASRAAAVARDKDIVH